MVEALILASFMWLVLVGGKAIFAVLITVPVIGSYAAWYMGLFGVFADSLQSGPSANLFYGLMIGQMFALPLGALFYGPGVIRKALAWMRQPKQPT